jgi:RNA polymerase sigma-70 factor, ECF subfamily
MEARTSEDRIVAVYRETIDPLYAYIARHCGGDRALAEDVTQEAWLRAVREWRRHGLPDRPLAWLITVAHNLLASYFRRRLPLQLDAISGHEPVAPDDHAARTESADLQAAVGQALNRLPPQQARLIEAFHFDDRQTANIAQGTGVSERAIEGRLRRARQRLRRELESIFGTGGSTR